MDNATLLDLLASSGGSRPGMSDTVLAVRIALGGSRRTGEAGAAHRETRLGKPQSPTAAELADLAGYRHLLRDPMVREALPAACSRRRRGVALVFALASAAVAVIAVSATQLAKSTTNHRSDSAAVVVTLGTPGLEGGHVYLAWATVPFASVYQVTVYDSTGSVLVDETSEDTTLAIPATSLAPGTPTFWRVRARVEAGRWLESRMGEFRMDDRVQDGRPSPERTGIDR